jgi:hypothetical protein
MRWFVFGTIACALAALGVVAVIQERNDDRDQVTVRRVRAPWRLIDLGRDGRTLKLVYDTSGCLHEDGHPVVHESLSAVSIDLYQGQDVGLKPSSEVFCTGELSWKRLDVRLGRPIGGRSLEGAGRLTSQIAPWSRVLRHGNGFLVVGVPRVVGLAPGDAVELLLRQRFHPRIRGARIGRVIAQWPKPGTAVRLTSLRSSVATVTLTLGR